MNGKTIWREVRFLGMILFGSVCYAIGFDLFLMLHQVNAGGVSGATVQRAAATLELDGEGAGALLAVCGPEDGRPSTSVATGAAAVTTAGPG